MNTQETKMEEGAIIEPVWAGMSELRKPSEPETNVGEAVEELVEKIRPILKNFRLFDSSKTYTQLEIETATKIAALMQNCENHEEPRNISQTDKELMDEMYEALIIAR